MKKLIVLIASAFLFVGGLSAHANYNYSPLGDVIASANSMSASRVVNAANLLDEFDQPAGLALGELKAVFATESHVYIVDQTHNRVIQLNANYRLQAVFPNEAFADADDAYKLNNPNGIHVAHDKLYIADTDNDRIVIFDLHTGVLLLEIHAPDDQTFENLRFRPLKISVDRTGRIFVIALDVFEGIMDFNPDGSFSRFFGTNRVSMSFFEALVYRLSSQIQRDRQALRLQATFASMAIDPEGYLYTVSRPDTMDVIKKLNFKGFDILNKNGYVMPVGDVRTVNQSRLVPTGRSNFVDIAVSRDGHFYSALDNNRGRIFTYDNEGNLLYIFGGLGNQSTQFRRPESLTYFGDDILVTDSLNRSLVVFSPTPFGTLINSAVRSYMNADYDQAKDTWEEILRFNSNYFLAYAGIGKAQLRNGNYVDAMDNLQLGFDQYNYSMAYEQYRNDRLEGVLPYLLVIGFAGASILFVRSLRASIKRDAKEGD